MHLSESKVLVIGLDGATFTLIKPLVEQGLLPNLARLIESGSHGDLRSTIQPTTAPAWSTFMTGVNQAKHGLYDFVRRQAESYNLEITNGSHIVAPTLFQIASRQGRRVISINVPYTFPPYPVNGVMVGGPFVPTVGREIVYPPAFYDTLKEIVPDYSILPDFDSRADDPMADYAAKLLRGIETREALALHLMQNEAWDLFTIVFMATDVAQHSFWECMEAPPGSSGFQYSQVISQVYQRLDRAIGRLLSQADQTVVEGDVTVIVLSDHGAGPFRLMINLNRWLSEAGYLRFREERSGLGQRVRRAVITRTARAYRRYVPPAWRAALRDQVGAKRFAQVKGAFESSLLTTQVDWDETRAYSLGAGGNIYINVAGREPQGTVQPGPAYERLRDELIARLATMVDPQTGEPLVEQVVRREELYAGPYFDLAPDLVIRWSDYGYWGRGQYDYRAPVFEKQRQFDFSDQPLTGSHRLEGILIINGASVKANSRLDNAQLVDLAPTILSLLGIEPLADMDGRLLEEAFTPAGLEHLRQGIEAGQVDLDQGEYAYDEEMEEKISEHLRSLGYL